VQLRDAERLIVRLRWLAMASWPPILLAIHPPVSPRLVWTTYGIAVAYVLATHVLNHNGRAVRATALGTTLADPIVTALICAVTPGLAKPQGMGMGLAISRTIVELHHGRLSVGPRDSGFGTTVKVVLPRESPSETGQRST